MDETLDFLLQDENILEAEISDVVDKNGKKTVGISITVGKSNEQCAEIISNLKEGEPQPKFEAFEILLTKSDLKKINKLIKEY
jgi:hypothetical protein